MNMNTSTYAAHENGQNSYEVEQAKKYARKFRVRWEWLLDGRGPMAPEDGGPDPAVVHAEIVKALTEEASALEIEDAEHLLGLARRLRRGQSRAETQRRKR